MGARQGPPTQARVGLLLPAWTRGDLPLPRLSHTPCSASLWGILHPGCLSRPSLPTGYTRRGHPQTLNPAARGASNASHVHPMKGFRPHWPRCYTTPGRSQAGQTPTGNSDGIGALIRLVPASLWLRVEFSSLPPTARMLEPYPQEPQRDFVRGWGLCRGDRAKVGSAAWPRASVAAILGTGACGHGCTERGRADTGQTAVGAPRPRGEACSAPTAPWALALRS